MPDERQVARIRIHMYDTRMVKTDHGTQLQVNVDINEVIVYHRDHPTQQWETHGYGIAHFMNKNLSAAIWKVGCTKFDISAEADAEYRTPAGMERLTRSVTVLQGDMSRKRLPFPAPHGGTLVVDDAAFVDDFVKYLEGFEFEDTCRWKMEWVRKSALDDAARNTAPAHSA